MLYLSYLVVLLLTFDVAESNRKSQITWWHCQARSKQREEEMFKGCAEKSSQTIM